MSSMKSNKSILKDKSLCYSKIQAQEAFSSDSCKDMKNPRLRDSCGDIKNSRLNRSHHSVHDSFHEKSCHDSHSRHTDFVEKSRTDSLNGTDNYRHPGYDYRDNHGQYLDGENLSHLLNAAYFRCRWKKSFCKSTCGDWFFLNKNLETANKTKFMFRQDFYYYRKDIEGRRYIRVEYEKDLYMVIVLPPLENFYEHFVNTANVLDIVKSSESYISQ